MNKLPGSMKNVGEKIKNIEIPNVFPEPSAAGVGNVGERKTLGELFSTGTQGTVNRTVNGTAGASGVKTLVGAGEHFTNGRKNRLKPDIRCKTGDLDLAQMSITYKNMIGSGYQQGTLNYGQSYNGQVFFRNNQPITAFPIWGR